MLYIIATPIGHLGDLSYRAVETLKQVDYILCEDTRHSRILMERYAIATPLKSFHKFKEKLSESYILEDLKAGQAIALISDAGTPLIADPGESLITACHAHELSVTVVPGPCALIAALTLSGFPSAPFQFFGFLPKAQGELRRSLISALLYKGTSVCYEAPHRILETLTLLHALAPQRKLSIARELTKQYEECLFGTAQELLTHFQTHPPRGEMVLLLSGCPEERARNTLPLKQLVTSLESEFSLHRTEAIKLAAEILGFSKREAYKEFF